MTRFRARLLAVGAAAMLLIGLAPATITATQPAPPGKVAKAVFFTSDGLRQDLVAKYAKDGLMPTMGGFLKNGTSAAHNGLLTQAPPNTGAGWYSLATGAWPAVHGSTNNTFHRWPAVHRPDRGLRPERPPGRVDRPVRRARRPQGRPGRVGRRSQRDDQRPDDRLPAVLLRPRRRDELHRQGR